MAVAHVQNWAGVNSVAGSVTLTGTAVTAGNWMVAAIKIAFAASIDSVPSPFSLVLSADTDPTGANKLLVYIGKAVGGETSFEFGETGTNGQGVLSEFTNILATSPLDVSAQAETASATTCSTGTTAETAQADSLAVAILCPSGGTISGTSCATDFTIGSEESGIRLSLAWKVLSATGTQAGTWSWTTARVSCSAIIVLKGLAAGGHPTAARFNQHPYSWGRKPNRSYR